MWNTTVVVSPGSGAWAFNKVWAAPPTLIHNIIIMTWLYTPCFSILQDTTDEDGLLIHFFF